MARTIRINGSVVEVEPATYRLRKGDRKLLDTIYAAQGGASAVVRIIIAAHIDSIRAQTASELGRPLEEAHTPLPTRKTPAQQELDELAANLGGAE